MKEFATLFAAIDQTTATNEKIAALVEYFSSAPPADAAWAVHFLSGRRPKRLVGSRKLAGWAAEEAGLPEWLFDEIWQKRSPLFCQAAERPVSVPSRSGSSGSFDCGVKTTKSSER